MWRWAWRFLWGVSAVICLVCVGDVIWHDGFDQIVIVRRPGFRYMEWHWRGGTIGFGSWGSGVTYIMMGDDHAWIQTGKWGDERILHIIWTAHNAQTGSWIFVNYWSVIGVTAVLPGLAALIWLKSRLGQRDGHCAVCGYDLRATPETCPECGTVVTRKEVT